LYFKYVKNKNLIIHVLKAFMPPPLPPLNISPTLSTEELIEMEGNERHNVEARIHCLRNINTLLNASMIHMQQYMNICSATR